MKILVIEDDPILNKNIVEVLQSENMTAKGVFDGLLADKILKRENFDCVIMDVNLPGKTGFELCSDFRIFNTNTPVLFLTAFSELSDKVKGYDCGADDYLTKPFFMRELILRINSLIKRNQTHAQQETTQITIADINIDQAKKKVFRQGKEIILTPREYQILLKLIQHPGEIISKQDLIQTVWSTSEHLNTNVIEVYISFLRNKLDKPFHKNSIKTKIGYGYYFDVDENKK